MANTPRKPHTLESIMTLIQDYTGVGAVFPSTFPTNAYDTCMVVLLQGGQANKDTVKYTSLQVVVRSQHPANAYDMAVELIGYLTSFVNAELTSGDYLLSSTAQHPYPLFMGQDENRRHMYSINFSLVLST